MQCSDNNRANNRLERVHALTCIDFKLTPIVEHLNLESFNDRLCAPKGPELEFLKDVVEIGFRLLLCSSSLEILYAMIVDSNPEAVARSLTSEEQVDIVLILHVTAFHPSTSKLPSNKNKKLDMQAPLGFEFCDKHAYLPVSLSTWHASSLRG